MHYSKNKLRFVSFRGNVPVGGTDLRTLVRRFGKTATRLILWLLRMKRQVADLKKICIVVDSVIVVIHHMSIAKGASHKSHAQR
jgi:hypothetical protein